MSDLLVQSMFSIKFVAFKTPSSMQAPVPSRLYFTFKFFEFDHKTDTVYL